MGRKQEADSFLGLGYFFSGGFCTFFRRVLQLFHPGFSPDERKHDVPKDDGCESRAAQQEAGQRAKQEDVLPTVLAPVPRLDLQGKHRYLGHQKPAEEQHKEQQEERVEAQRSEEGMLPQSQRAPEERIGGRRQSDELCALARIEVELGQAKGREGRHDEGRIGQDAAQRHQLDWVVYLVEEIEDDGAGCQTEGHYVGQRIQFLTDGSGNAEGACR